MSISNEMTNTNGLANIGNTCYMNAALQLLIRCDMVTVSVLTSKDNSEIVGIYKNFIKNYKSVNKKVINPREIKQYMGQKVKTFRGFNQNDSHEFIIYMLDHIEEQFKKTNVYKCIVSCLFDCKTEKIIKSKESNEKSITKENVRFLCLPVPDVNEDVNIDDCFELYSSPDIIDDWETPKGRREKAIKRVKIVSYPKYLIFQFKRYNNRGQKINKDINVSRIWVSPNKDVFKLKGFVLQSGGTMGGHYVSFIIIKGSWFCFDDSRVSKISLGDAMSLAQKAYLILYVKSKSFTKTGKILF